MTPAGSKGAATAGAADIGAQAVISLNEEDVMMLNTDLSPFYRSTVGFDRLFSMLDRVAGGEQNAPTYPPYNIERTGENAYRITLAVAGFGENELSVETRENTLTVRGSKEAQKDEKRDMLYQGIAARAFERRFQLADHVVVTGAASENGLLHIDLVREVPEAQKPRTIAINKGGAKTIEAVKAPAAQAA
jgi:molecular chaperone IbpA